MGMTIDEAIKYYENKNVVLTEEEALANTLALNTMRKYQKLQAEYENRLKADLKAILVELQLKIEELDVSDVVPEYQDGAEETKEYIANMIEEKINSLKEA